MTFLVCPCLVCLWMLEEGLVALDVGRERKEGWGGIASNVGRRGEVGGAEGGAHSFKCWGRKGERWRVGLTAPNRIS